jgi:hypothetical protein
LFISKQNSYSNLYHINRILVLFFCLSIICAYCTIGKTKPVFNDIYLLINNSNIITFNQKTTINRLPIFSQQSKLENEIYESNLHFPALDLLFSTMSLSLFSNIYSHAYNLESQYTNNGIIGYFINRLIE